MIERGLGHICGEVVWAVYVWRGIGVWEALLNIVCVWRGGEWCMGGVTEYCVCLEGWGMVYERRY